MKIPFVHKSVEGGFLKQGINYRSDGYSKLVLAIKIWRGCLYLRWRADWMCEGENTCKRFTWHWNWNWCNDGWYTIQSGLRFNYDYQYLEINGMLYTIEILQDAGPLVMTKIIRTLHDC